MKLIIELDKVAYDLLTGKIETANIDLFSTLIKSVQNGTPLEEIPNPCIECSQNCCVCELNGEKCECQKVYVVKENKE